MYELWTKYGIATTILFDKDSPVFNSMVLFPLAGIPEIVSLKTPHFNCFPKSVFNPFNPLFPVHQTPKFMTRKKLRRFPGVFKIHYPES